MEADSPARRNCTICWMTRLTVCDLDRSYLGKPRRQTTPPDRKNSLEKRAWRLFLVDAELTVVARVLSNSTTTTMCLAIAGLTACSARVAVWRSPLWSWRMVPFSVRRYSCFCEVAAGRAFVAALVALA